MTIEINIQALTDPQGSFLFRQNSITALKLIQDHGHQLIISGGSLTEQQQQLLAQEEIDILIEAEGADYRISSGSDSQLQLNKGDEQILAATTWIDTAIYLSKNARKASFARTTNETDIKIELNLDGTGKSDIDTGLKFYDHMLDQIARHGLIDLKIHCKGDLEVDEHHTIEDVAIALGQTITEALGDKKGLERYAFVLPMDEAQATVALDLSGRPYLEFDVPMTREYVGDFPTEMLEHFYYSLAMNLRATLHVKCTGRNDHHMIEACFKGLARTLKMAIEINGRIKDKIPSSKGAL